MFKSSFTLLTLSLLGLWLSATAFFIGPENLANFVNDLNNLPANIKVSSAPLNNNFKEITSTAPNNFGSLGAALWGIVREALAATDDLTVVKSGGGNAIIYNRYGGGLVFGCGFNCSQTIVPTYLDGGGGKHYVSIYALPAPDSDFVSWSGCDTTSGTTLPKSCQVNYTGSSKTVTATFAPAVANNVLTITKSGSTGLGTVSMFYGYPSDSPSNFACDNNCLEISSTFKSVRTVSISATADTASGSTFAGWGGDAASCGSASPCSITMNGAKNVTANFTSATPPAAPAAVYKLTVKKSGSGLSKISSGLPCGFACLEASATFYSPQSKTLSNLFGTNSSYVNWSGCDSSSATSCSIASVNGVKTATLISNASVYSLDVDKTGSGQGTVTSTDDTGGGWSQQINCGPTCNNSSAVFGISGTATLSAVADANSTFVGWFEQDGTTVYPGCSGTGNCAVTMDNHKRVSAKFNFVPQTLTVNKTGSTGTGVITGTGINCGADCSETYPQGTSVTLTASPDPNSTFSSWSGGGCSGNGSCTVTMSAAKTVTGVFNIKQVTLTLVKPGIGKVNISPPNVDCSSYPDTVCGTYSNSYNYGASVTLTASLTTADVVNGRKFEGWGGDCASAGTANTCTLANMNGDKNVYANFIDNKIGVAVTIAGWTGGNVYIWAIASPGVWNGTLQYWGSGLDESRYDVAMGDTSIDCTPSSHTADDCGHNYHVGDTVILLVEPWAGYYVDKLQGCTSTGKDYYGVTCTVSSPTNIGVTFKPVVDTSGLSSNPFSLTVAKLGTGQGVITSNPNIVGIPINCGSLCFGSFSGNTPVILTAKPDSDSELDYWIGCDTVDYSVDPPTCVAYTDTQVFTPGTVYVRVPSTDSRFPNKCVDSPYRYELIEPAHPATYAPIAPFTVTHPITGNPIPAGEVYWIALPLTPATPAVYGWVLADGCAVAEAVTYTTYVPKTVTAVLKKRKAALTVHVAGSGAGVVYTPVGYVNGIWCGKDCTDIYDPDYSLILGAKPAPGSRLVTPGWDCPTGSPPGILPPTCTKTVALTENQNDVYVTFNRTILNVLKIGGGAGLVDLFSLQSPTLTNSGEILATNGEVAAFSISTKINCGLDCYEDFNGHVARVKLSAIPDSGSTFVGWQTIPANKCSSPIVGDLPPNNPCYIPSVTDIFDVIALFKPIASYEVTVQKAGLGAGSVTGPNGLTCGDACPNASKIYSGSEMQALAEQKIILNADPASGSVFDGWSGCSSNGDSVSGTTCTLTANSINKIVTAIFNPSAPPALLPSPPPTTLFTLNISKSNGGSVLGLDSVDCGVNVLTCSKTFTSPTTVNLNAEAADGSEFSGWGDDAATCANNLACPVEFLSCLVGVSSINPNVGIKGTTVNNVSVLGTNFVSGATTVKLTKSGQSDINCAGFTFTDANTLSNGSCAIPAGAAAGAWDVEVTAGGKFGKLTGGFTVALFDYSLAVSPTSGSASQGSPVSPSPTVTVTSLGGTAQTVTFSAIGLPSGATASFSPPSCIPSGTCASTLTINTTTAAPGSHNVTIRGTSSGVPPKDVSYTFTVGLPAPTVSAITPDSGANNASVTGISVTGTNFVSGATVKLTKSGETDINCTGFTFTNATTLSSGSCDITSADFGNWNVVVTNPDGQSGTLTNGFTVNEPFDYVLSVSPSSATFPTWNPPAARYLNIYITAAQTAGTAQAVSFSASDVPTGGNLFIYSGGNCTPSGGSCTVQARLDGSMPYGTYNLTFTAGTSPGVPDKTAILQVTIAPFDYSLGLSSASGSAAQGGSVATTLTATKTGGTAAPATFSATGLPAGATASFSSPSCNPTCSSTLTISAGDATPTGSYPITITSTASGLPDKTITYDLTVTPELFNYSIVISPDSGTAKQTDGVNSIITVTKTSGAGQTVTLSTLPLTNISSFVIPPTLCDLSAASTCTTAISVKPLGAATNGSYTINVKGVSSGLADKLTPYTLTVDSTAPAFDYSVVANPATAPGPLAAGATITSTITVSKTAGINERYINFNSVPAITGAAISFSPVKCLPTVGSCTSIMSITNTAIPVGTYTVTINGNSGNGINVLRTATYTFTVAAAPTVSAINPAGGVNDASVNITSVTGVNFVSGATVKLTKSGETDINCTGFTFTNATTLSSGSCPITGAVAGQWNVVVTNPNGLTGTLTNGFAIIIPPPPVVAIDRTGTGILASGNGTVSINNGITTTSCGNTTGICLAQFLSGTDVTLTATPAPDHVFTGFFGGGCSTSPCTLLNVTSNVTVSATFKRKLILNVSKLGGGIGSTITGNATNYNDGDIATLTANPDTVSSYTFKRWDGVCAGTSPTCTVLMTANKSAIAIFELSTSPITNPILSVFKTGSGIGSVISSAVTPAINCGAVCAQPYPSGTSITLNTTSVLNNVFSGWSGGGCSGTSPCNPTITSDVTVTANFDMKRGLYVSKLGNGSITATGIACGTAGTDCSEYYVSGTNVTLTAAADAGYIFDGWYGACSGSSSCAVPMNANHTVSARFIAAP